MVPVPSTISTLGCSILSIITSLLISVQVQGYLTFHQTISLRADSLTGSIFPSSCLTPESINYNLFFRPHPVRSLQILLMFEVVFIDQIVKLGSRHDNAERMWNEIASKYRETKRHYHTLQHLEHMFLNILEVKNEINDWQSVIFSIAFHDVIYDQLRNDNEERSAAFAETRLSRAGSPISQVEKCKEQILATKTHQPSGDTDTNYFIDADLAILGADPGGYSHYASNIRKEYSHYPDPIYKAGRKKVLMYFLRMPQIFK